MIPVVDLHGTEPRRVSIEAVDLAAAAAYEPDNGVYLVARTFNGGMEFLLDRHIDRMESSARTLGREIVVPRLLVRRVLADLRREAGFEEVRFRVTAVLDDPVWYRISMERVREVPGELRRHGVVCALWEGAARRNAEVKSTAWMHERFRTQPRPGGEDSFASTPPIYERLLVDNEGRVLEGTSSNVYFVFDEALRTAGGGVLAGIARRVILEVAERIVPVRLEALPEVELNGVSEAFLSSATRGVVPIRSVGEVEYGDPGPVTHAISLAYERRVAALLRPLLPE